MTTEDNKKRAQLIEQSIAEAERAEEEAKSIEVDDGDNNVEEMQEANTEQDANKYDVEGILEVADQGYGFMRFDNFMSSSEDVYVAQTQIRRFRLRTGDKIFGVARRPKMGERRVGKECRSRWSPYH